MKVEWQQISNNDLHFYFHCPQLHTDTSDWTLVALATTGAPHCQTCGERMVLQDTMMMVEQTEL